MLRGLVGRDARHLLEVDPAQEDAAEVDRGQREQEKDRNHERELDHALATRSLTATPQ